MIRQVMKGLEYPFRGNDTKHFKTPVYISYTFNEEERWILHPNPKQRPTLDQIKTHKFLRR